MEIGIDCVDISRFNEDIIQKNILKKIFTQNEIQYCNNKKNPPQHYAARFAGKEAVIKALFSYNFKVLMNQIEILNKENGIPFVRFLDKKYRVFDIKISLTHSREVAMAFVIVNKIQEMPSLEKK